MIEITKNKEAKLNIHF